VIQISAEIADENRYERALEVNQGLKNQTRLRLISYAKLCRGAQDCQDIKAFGRQGSPRSQIRLSLEGSKLKGINGRRRTREDGRWTKR
jgi:hypothetical protein